MATRRFMLPFALLLALAGGVWLAWRTRIGSPKVTASPRRDVAAANPGSAEQATAAPPEAKRSQDAAATFDDAATNDSPPNFPCTRRCGALVVEVLDAVGAPVAGVGVHIDSWIGGHIGALAIADDRNLHRDLRSDGGGRAVIPDLAEGAYTITARADDGRAARESLDYSTALKDLPLRIRLSEHAQQPPAIEIHVVGKDNAAVADSEVELYGAVLGLGLVGGPAHPSLTARSDTKGIARFDGVRWVTGIAFAKTPDGRSGTVVIGEEASDAEVGIPDLSKMFEGASALTSAESEEITESLQDRYPGGGLLAPSTRHSTDGDFTAAELVVAAPGGIAGSIEFPQDAADPDGALAGATIEAWLATGHVTWEASHGRGTSVRVEQREFAFDGLPAGDYALILHAPGGARLVLPRAKPPDGDAALDNSVAPPLVKVEEGARAQVTLHATVGGTIHGRVHLPDGAPVAGARIVDTFGPWRFEPGDAFVRRQMHVWTFDEDSGLESLHPLTHVVGRTDAHGEYRLTGLQPGLHRIMVTARGLSFDHREWTPVADNRVLELDHVLEPAGALQGIAPRNGLLGVTRVGAPRPDVLATLIEGRSFAVGGLRPGEYILADFAEDRNSPPVERARATVEVGRTTFVDLTDAPGPIEIAGRVVDGHGGVPDAVVEFDSICRHVDGAGSFVFHAGLPIEGGLELTVETDRFTETFGCGLDPGSGGGWHGTLRLGDETLRIEVRDAQTGPASGWVELHRSNGTATPIGSEQFQSKRLALDGNGACTIDHLSPGTYDVKVRAPGGVRLSTKVEVPRAEPLRLELAELGSVVVRLVGADGKPTPGWSVSVCSYLRDGAIPDDFAGHDEWFDIKSAMTGGDGVARFEHIRSGRLVVRAEAMPQFLDLFGDSKPVIAPTPADMPSAPRPAQLELHPGETKEVELEIPARESGGR